MYTLFTVKDKDYKLRLTTKNIVQLEKLIGCNPIMIFGQGDKIPTVTEMVYILYTSLLSYNHGISLADTYDIFDDYLEEHDVNDFIPVIIEVYRASGIIGKENNEKNV